MRLPTSSGSPSRRSRTAIVVIGAVAVGLLATGCGGTQPSTPGVSRPSPGGTSASPARPMPTASRSTPGSAPATGESRTPSAPVTVPPRPVFQASTSALTAAMRNRMTGVSWHPGCPVPLSALRLLRLSYWGFDHAVHQGELIVNTSAAASLTQAFALLFAARFPIRQMRVVDDFGGDDERSMLADNTSAFNCRLVPGTSTWAQHAYGLAVDINPFENPEIRSGKADPPAAIGWPWGGDWNSLQDYMHFSANGL